jgi:hypothetical protein
MRRIKQNLLNVERTLLSAAVDLGVALAFDLGAVRALGCRRWEGG